MEESSTNKKVLDQDVPPPGWGTDDLISFSKETGKYIKTEEDGSEMEWNPKYKAWMPMVPNLSTPLIGCRFMTTK